MTKRHKTLLDKKLIIQDGEYHRKYLVYDIENTPSIGAYYNRYHVGNIVWRLHNDFLLSWSYSYLGEDKVYHKSIHDYMEWKKAHCNKCGTLVNPYLAEELLTRDIHKVLREAEVLIGQNSEAFDIKKLNARFIKYGLDPLPNDIASFDTKKEYKKIAKTDSHSLDDLGDELSLGKKLETRKNIQRACMENQKGAWEELKQYNNQDIVVTKKLYLKIRGFKKTGGANYNILKGTVFNCTMCGSMHTVKEGIRGGYQRWSCNNCGKWMRGERVKMEVALK